ncbi:MAG: fibrobacter succinogenes major paralogous domain-containing protein [Fibromonadaceae bacterium]|jgi:uncharacterized protein (TIGR02145 family)|nr:fibrobacter succinogenes major paralogous domain-containing protein [Fibromonadaceae bacterium]
METKLNSKGKRFFAPAIAAGLMLAMALTLSCSSSNDEGGGNNGGGSSCDIKDYSTVQIGDQTWMAENLNCNIDGKCYGNNNANCAKYGRLYDWEAAKKACPYGWHLPSNEEWDKLYRYADSTSGMNSPYSSETAGKYLKATSGWSSGGNGTDAHGFSALPGGNGSSVDNFGSAGYYGYYWSSSEYDSDGAYYRYIYYNIEGAGWSRSDKNYLRSVRCVKD